MPTAVLAARLAIPERTARHRLGRLRQAGTVVTGTDGLHRLAGIAPAPVAGTPTTDVPGGRETDRMGSAHSPPLGGYGTALTVLAVAGIGLVAVAVLRRGPSPPPEPLPPSSYVGGWYPGPGW